MRKPEVKRGKIITMKLSHGLETYLLKTNRSLRHPGNLNRSSQNEARSIQKAKIFYKKLKVKKRVLLTDKDLEELCH
jgi:hypothetical protein